MEEIVWRPYGDYLERSRIQLFMARHKIKTVRELQDRANKNPEWFYGAIFKDLGIEWFTPYHTLYDDSKGMPWTKWFLGGKTNIVHNCLDRHIRNGRQNKIALFWEGDDGSSAEITYGGLFALVNQVASAMRKAGVKKGDCVAVCMTISIEAVAIMFAAMKIGAIPMLPAARIAPEDLVKSFVPGRPKILFMHDGYKRGGQVYPRVDVYEQVIRKLPTLKSVVIVNRLGVGLETRKQCISWDAFLEMGKVRGRVKTASLNAEDLALILYSSGTTSLATEYRPKIVLHTHGGLLAQAPKEVGYAFDCREDDVFYWFTNIGWMMVPWELIGALFFGASVVLYEGTHLYQTPHRMFEIIEKYRITIFGFTPTAMRAMKGFEQEFTNHDRSSIRILGSTGEVLDPETWKWYFETFGEGRCPIINISGGTELMGCLVFPLPNMPQKPGTVGGPALGLAVDVVDEDGNPVREKPGYLVCKAPFPSMTRGFLGDPERYLKTYFRWGPHLWVHGDLVEIDSDGAWFHRGRVDDLIIRGGVKHDPARIEQALVQYPGSPRVIEAAAIGVPDPLKGEKIVCFVVFDCHISPLVLSDFLSRLKEYVGRSYDPMAKPDVIHVISRLPNTIAAKIPRALIKNVYQGKEVDDLSKINNPEVLQEIRRLGERR